MLSALARQVVASDDPVQVRHGYIKAIKGFLQVSLELKYKRCLVVHEKVDSLLDVLISHLVSPRFAILESHVTVSLIPLTPSAEGKIKAPEDWTGFGTAVRNVYTVTESFSLVVVRVMYHR